MRQDSQETPLKGLNAIVIGAGFGGLGSAIELARLGATVRIFDVIHVPISGDVIRFEANASRVMEPWGRVLDEITTGGVLLDNMTIMDKDGKILLEQPMQPMYEGYPNNVAKRGEVQRSLLDYASSIGVEVNLGAPVAEVFESDTSAGVRIGDELHEADCVLAGDGVRSKARAFVTGVADRPKKSGYAIYRTWFPLDMLEGDSKVEGLARSEQPICKIWIAPESHAVLTTNFKMRAATCFLTHKDLSDINEDWNQPGRVQDMLACAEGWDAELRHIIQHIPTDSLIDHKMLWRDPVQKWVSPKGRICLVGDAAHPHLPTSGTGAAQALEGAATIGALMQKSLEASGNSPDIPLVFRAYEKLRYERTSLTQRMGWETRHAWHQTDWDAVAADPNYLKLPQHGWVLGHDARKYARDNFEGVVHHLRNGTPFVSTNVPKGHVHEEWTVEALLQHDGQTVGKEFYRTRG
ncbi:hypothetical protein BKA66DRAFT_509595 [Pyrenochaeta sp. MPI-SDFR-AT-0127]|nr:hypothetical protein BKA66DRAFT_509595 [Pyrenochaeta sp. MPI-SDFR-AT-0127]